MQTLLARFQWNNKIYYITTSDGYTNITMKLTTNMKTKNVYIAEMYDKHITGFTSYKQEYLTGPDINGTLMIQYV